MLLKLKDFFKTFEFQIHYRELAGTIFWSYK